jgi:hypothetical protein
MNMFFSASASSFPSLQLINAFAPLSSHILLEREFCVASPSCADNKNQSITQGRPPFFCRRAVPFLLILQRAWFPDKKPWFFNRKPWSFDKKPRFFSHKPWSFDKKPWFFSRKPWSFDKKPRFFDRKPWSSTQKPWFFNSKPRLFNSKQREIRFAGRASAAGRLLPLPARIASVPPRRQTFILR